MKCRNRRKSKTYLLLTLLQVSSFYIMMYLSSVFTYSLLTASYLLTSFLFIYVGKCPFEIAVQFKPKDYLKACRRIYGRRYTVALIGYG